MSNNYTTSSRYNVKANAIIGKLTNRGTFDHHFEDMLRRVRTEFECTEIVKEGFEYVTENGVVELIAEWSSLAEQGQLDRTAELNVSLRDSFRRCGVKRYVVAGGGWVCEKPTAHPEDDGSGEWIQVLAIERNGPRKYAHAEIMYEDGSVTLGPWQVSDDVPQCPLSELLQEGYPDQVPTVASPPTLPDDLPDRVYERHDMDQLTRFDSVDLVEKLGKIADQLQSGELAAMCYVTFSKRGDFEVTWTGDTFTYTCSCCGEREEFNLEAFVRELGPALLSPRVETSSLWDLQFPLK
jgi:hypothetical protein